jgi:hypothetical protein
MTAPTTRATPKIALISGRPDMTPPLLAFSQHGTYAALAVDPRSVAGRAVAIRIDLLSRLWPSVTQGRDDGVDSDKRTIWS